MKDFESKASGVGSGWDIVSGTALGVLLGLVTGLAATPVASAVVSALVALLGGLFGLGPKPSLELTLSSARRVACFAFAAAVVLPCAVWMRTHETLGPSLVEQKQTLRNIGYRDGTPEQKDLLRYLRYGLLPATVKAAEKPVPSIPTLYSDVPEGFCEEISRTESMDDFITIAKRYGSVFESKIRRIEQLPADSRAHAVDVARIIMCSSSH